MKKLKFVLPVFIVALSFIALSGCSGFKSTVTNENKVEVQTAMNEYIQKKLKDGNNKYDISGIATEFDYLHSGVKTKGGAFVSCADFKVGTDVYDVDYYAKKINGKMTIVKELYHKKNGEKINTILWEATAK